MPTYNQSHYLAWALRSCLAQDYPDFQLIVVDDASEDSTPDLLQWFLNNDSLARERMRVITLAHNRGPAYAMNAAMTWHGPDAAVCFAASDDIQEPNKISVLAAALGDADFCYSGYYHASIKGEPTLEVHPKPLSKETIKDNSAMSGGAILIRASVLRAIPFREELRVNEDMALAWDLLRAGKTFNVTDVPTFRYRLTKKSMSYARKAEVEAVSEQIRKEIDQS